MTTLLYYEDPTLLEFDAEVLETRRRDDRTEVVLDRSAFYPEGGGQPADHGEIAGTPVVHVRKEEGRVVHVLGDDLPEDAHGGVRVSARVDATRRRDYQQQHTGQHILSAALMRVGDYPTMSVHQGAGYTTIEIDAAEIPPGDLEAVERLANQAIEDDLPVRTAWADGDSIDQFPLRRPPQVSGSIRIVQVGDFDCVACGGVHLERTGRVRLVRVYSVETIRGHVRIAWKIGDRAIAHYRLCSEIVSHLSASMSAQPAEIPERVEKQEARTKQVELENRGLRGRLHSLIARSLAADAESEHGQRLVTAEFDDEPQEFLRGVTEELTGHTGLACCLVNRSGGRLQWSIGIAPGSILSFDTFRAELLPVIDGKGGGKPPIWQGIGTRVDQVQAFLTRFRRLAEAAIHASE